jgi:thiamine biosynthesis lipoprotein
MRYLKAFVVFGVAVLIAVVIFMDRDARREAVFYPFGGIPLKVVAYERSPSEFRDDMEAVKARAGELERQFNRFDADSDLSRINREAAVTPIEVSGDLATVFARSFRWYAQSGGAFDPTVAPLIELWRVSGEGGRVPSEEELDRARGIVGLKEVALTHDGRVLFAREGMALDFGAIAKGFIADEVARLLKERGVKRGIVDIGGNALAFGEGSFTFGVADPSSLRDSENLMGTVDVSGGAVITSGNYERFVTIEGKRYSHIIDPRTGKPIANGLMAVTVIGGEGADADAMATSLMVLGKEKGLELLSSMPDTAAILVEHEGEGWKVWASKSLQPRLKLADTWADKVEWF